MLLKNKKVNLYGRQLQLHQPLGGEQHLGQCQQQRRDHDRERALRRRRQGGERLQLLVRLRIVAVLERQGEQRRRRRRRMGMGIERGQRRPEERDPGSEHNIDQEGVESACTERRQERRVRSDHDTPPGKQKMGTAQERIQYFRRLQIDRGVETSNASVLHRKYLLQ